MENRHTDLIMSSHAFKKLRDDCAHGLCKHAYVFSSVDFDALETLTALFICLCEKGEVDPFTLKRIFDGGYLDVVRLPRAEKKGKMDVEDVTYLTDTAYLTPAELKSKYYVVAATEPLGAAVQNKMLKTLEEPPASARFIVFSAGNDLLPTVLSRCSNITLEAFSVETIVRELTGCGVDDVTALFAAVVARGNIGTARKIAADPGYKKAYETAVDFLLHVKRSPQILPSASEVIAAKDKLGAFIDYTELILRDVMAYKECGVEAVVLKPAVNDIITIARASDTYTVLSLMPLLTRARERMRLYGNTTSIIDELLFSVLEVQAKCRK